MTEFKDVNVGDKVRLTAKNGAEHVTVIDDVAGNGTQIHDFMHGWYFAKFWSVEVLEHAPKPLPNVPGLFVSDTVLGLFRYSGNLWTTDASGRWEEIAHTYVPRDLKRLVPESDVEAARKATVSEIVEYMRKKEYFLSADEIEYKFGGGKA